MYIWGAGKQKRVMHLQRFTNAGKPLWEATPR